MQHIKKITKLANNFFSLADESWRETEFDPAGKPISGKFRISEEDLNAPPKPGTGEGYYNLLLLQAEDDAKVDRLLQDRLSQIRAKALNTDELELYKERAYRLADNRKKGIAAGVPALKIKKDKPSSEEEIAKIISVSPEAAERAIKKLPLSKEEKKVLIVAIHQNPNSIYGILGDLSSSEDILNNAKSYLQEYYKTIGKSTPSSFGGQPIISEEDFWGPRGAEGYFQKTPGYGAISNVKK